MVQSEKSEILPTCGPLFETDTGGFCLYDPYFFTERSIGYTHYDGGYRCFHRPEDECDCEKRNESLKKSRECYIREENYINRNKNSPNKFAIMKILKNINQLCFIVSFLGFILMCVDFIVWVLLLVYGMVNSAHIPVWMMDIFGIGSGIFLSGFLFAVGVMVFEHVFLD